MGVLVAAVLVSLSKVGENSPSATYCSGNLYAGLLPVRWYTMHALVVDCSNFVMFAYRPQILPENVVDQITLWEVRCAV